MAKPNDTELVLSARQGDHDAFAALVERHRPMVVSVVSRLASSDSFAADAAQESAIRALIGLDRLRSPERFGAWYVGIALNVARRWLRDVAAAPLPEELIDTQQLDPAVLAEAAEMAQAIRRAVCELPPGQRDATLAFYWQGLTQAEAALELGVSPQAVKARLHQARNSLNTRLAPLIRTEEEYPMTTTDIPGPNFVDAEVIEVRRSATTEPGRGLHVIVLKEKNGDRSLPIYVGVPEAIALASSLQAVDTPRPMAYQFSANLLAAASARTREVRITRLAEGTFYAEVIVDSAAGSATVDARPSDALNLAVLINAQIRIDTNLLDDPEAIRHSGWREFPTTARDLAAEMRDRHEQQHARLAEYQRTGEWPTLE
jgi:RNA polymerase sigma factor (sigma-70 family)